MLRIIGAFVLAIAASAPTLGADEAAATPDPAPVPRASVRESQAVIGDSAEAPSVPTWKQIRYGNPNALFLRSQVGLVVDEEQGVILYGRDIDKPRPIASLTKLLTVMTILDAALPPEEEIEVTREDRDRLKSSRSSLRYGTVLSREDLLKVAIVASDNRAASALARTYPGGRQAMIRAMNDKIRGLGLSGTQVMDASGLNEENISTGRDLAKIVYVARRYPLIEEWSTTRNLSVFDRRTGAELAFRNTNSLVHRDSWDITLSKTGFTSEAGNCLVMRTTIAGRRLILVLLNSWGKLSKYGDAGRIRRWLVASEQKAREHEAHAGIHPTDSTTVSATN